MNGRCPRTQFVLAWAIACSGVAGRAAEPVDPGRPYNVLLIMIDDHKPDLHTAPGGIGPVDTPNLERLAARGTWFTRAYVDAPACCPSRTALVTGVHAARSGVYYNNQAYRRVPSWISRAETFPARFKANGYLAAHFGKITHNRYLSDDEVDYSPGQYRMFNRDATHRDGDLAKFIQPGSEVRMWTEGWSWGALPDDWDRDDPTKLQQDTEFARGAAAMLRQRHSQPLFLAVGFWRPHVTWTVPQRYFDRFPLDRIELPPGYRPDDGADTPHAAQWLATHRGEHAYITENGLWKKALQAKYASTAYVDEQVGTVLDALEAGPNRENTIVIFAADNGWHTGEKDHWSKFYLSEQACRVVFSVLVPGLPTQVCERPVSLTDVYPTLMALCGLGTPTTHRLDGEDLTPLLRDARAPARLQPVMSTYGRGCHSLRDERYRYTRYRDGSEELYDHTVDPHEWHNLAGDERFNAEKGRLAAWLPTVDAPEVPSTTSSPDPNGWDDAILRETEE